ncbi:MAG: hypothetical protein ACTTJS_08150 [Wolinella sp.]
MVKNLIFAILFFACSGWADVLEQKVAALMDAGSYGKNQKFIDMLFKDKRSFYNDGRLDFAKVTAKLKDNGLLKLVFGAPRELQVSFVTQGSPLFFTSAITSSLQGLGYYYFAPKSAEYEDGIYKLEISMTTEHAIDPTLLIAEVMKYGYEVVDISRKSYTEWSYQLELVSARLPDAITLEYDIEAEISRPSGEYWFDIGSLSGTIYLEQIGESVLYPSFTLFDAAFKIVSLYQFEESDRSFSMKIPVGVRFVRVTDTYSSANIKGGIRVKLTR